MKKYRWLLAVCIIMALVLVVSRSAVVGAEEIQRTRVIAWTWDTGSQEITNFSISEEDITALLTECLEFIPDAEYDGSSCFSVTFWPDTRTDIEKAKADVEAAKERLIIAQGKDQYYKDRDKLIAKIKKTISILKGENK